MQKIPSAVPLRSTSPLTPYLRWGGLLLVIIVVVSVLSSSVQVIGPGQIGLKFNKAGSSRGLSQTNVVSGYVLVNPITTEIVTYPRAQQSYSWTKSASEGSPGDESFTFNTADQVTLNGDVNFGYQIDPKAAPAIYIRFGPDVDTITRTYIRSVVRNAITRQASGYTAEQLLGKGRSAFEDASEREVVTELTPSGFLVRNFSFIGELRAPEAVVQSINAKFSAQQAAIQAENKVVQSKAEAQQAVALAEGDAQAILVRAEAQAKANKVLAASLTPELIQNKQIEKWNGALPTVSGGSGSGFLINLPAKVQPAPTKSGSAQP
ncbi:prohibitin family protein [Deinococcus rubellus]|uniref:SPFH domain-containing protein n=1 Tax=Deinococcus rubellus TaxID=1889240 RepID=A0ABY5YKX5_9DEIO|nr:SPFH domain-containing protein [Deinococcus rubellus]UWX65002.1 SPFH domain-containing protein [Deinococcus rubellus]